MKAKEIRNLTKEEMEQRERESRDELLAARLKQSVGDDIENPLAIRSTRRDIARLLTVMGEGEKNRT